MRSDQRFFVDLAFTLSVIHVTHVTGDILLWLRLEM